jgi:hypothetical protein
MNLSLPLSVARGFHVLCHVRKHQPSANIEAKEINALKSRDKKSRIGAEVREKNKKNRKMI